MPGPIELLVIRPRTPVAIFNGVVRSWPFYGLEPLLIIILSLLFPFFGPVATSGALSTPPPDLVFSQLVPAIPDGTGAAIQIDVAEGGSCRLTAPESAGNIGVPDIGCPSYGGWMRIGRLPPNTSSRPQAWPIRLTVMASDGTPLWQATTLVTVRTSGYRGLATGGKVTVIGDSITNASKMALLAVLTTTRQINVDARSGYTINQQFPALSAALSSPFGHPDDAVMNLGTNDAFMRLLGGSVSGNIAPWAPTPPILDWHAMYDAMASSLASTPCVLIATMNTHGPDQTFNGIMASQNAVIRQIVSSHQNMHVLAWNKLLGEHPDWFDHRDFLTAVHPNEAGQIGYAKAIKHTLNAECPQ